MSLRLSTIKHGNPHLDLRCRAQTFGPTLGKWGPEEDKGTVGYGLSESSSWARRRSVPAMVNKGPDRGSQTAPSSLCGRGRERCFFVPGLLCSRGLPDDPQNAPRLCPVPLQRCMGSVRGCG